MPGSLRSEILSRHRASLHGRLRGCIIRSAALGISKPFYVYEPPLLARQSRLPVVYLFRGHEREWVNFREDHSRQVTTAIEDLDKRIREGLLPPILAVMPGLNSADNHVPSLGVNMAGAIDARKKGLGSGRFWDYLTDELMPRIEADYPQTAGGMRLGAGFSLGGYTLSLLALHRPGVFDHAAIYDGLFMWPGHRDPRVKPTEPFNDAVWLKNGLFDAAFGAPRSRAAMMTWNPTDTLIEAPASMLAALNSTTWWISCASADGNRGNKDRARFFRSLLKESHLPLGFDSVFFDAKAAHTWHWTDRFLIKFLSSLS